mgnify:CR=1 FL=1
MHISATPEENTAAQEPPVTSPEIKEDDYKDTTVMEDQEEVVGNCDSNQFEAENSKSRNSKSI